jgi:hypothetical protein
VCVCVCVYQRCQHLLGPQVDRRAVDPPSQKTVLLWVCLAQDVVRWRAVVMAMVTAAGRFLAGPLPQAERVT